MSKNVTRLFEQFQPEHYELQITPDADAMTFSGIVIIKGKKVGRPSQRLTFHQSDLVISQATLVKHDAKGDQEFVLSRINKQASFDEVRLHTHSMIYPGNYTVTLHFSGIITRPMNGLYPCFFEEKGVQKKLLATQFESHYARQVFPCIDEPEAKAVFDLALTTPSGQTVLSNTPVAQQKTAGKLTTTIFEPTPRMSVYLLAFIIGEMGYKEAETAGGVTVRTYATPENVPFTEFALEVAVKCLEFYNDYFGIDYPLAKCDLVGLPDFASGAMENWGCITFREHTMFVDPANTSLGVKQYVAMVVAHELAHQWFGNLVTMRWWTDLWLNEGFASWIEYMGVDHIFPEWDMWTQFVTDEQQIALRLDALENTHPIEVAVRHPDEIHSIFDTISYNKGSSAIHMLHQYLGAGDFRDGLRLYLKTHKYANTDAVDLWRALEEVSQKPVQEFMHAWISQPGFPVVTAAVTDTNVELKQARFYANPLQAKDDDIRWPVPLNSSLTQDTLSSKQAILSLPEATAPFKLNHDQGGFYRTIYTETHLQKLGQAVGAGDLSPLDRLGLLSDNFEAAKAGYQDTTAALSLLHYYKQEDNNAVWDVITGVLGGTRSVMNDKALRESMKPFVQKLVALQLKRLGWAAKKDEPHFDSLLRPTILGLASMVDEPSVVAECLKRFGAMKAPEDLPNDLRGVIYGCAARNGDVKTFDKLLALHNNTTLAEERVTLAGALTGFKQPELVQRALDYIDTDTVRLQDVTYWVAYSFTNRYARMQTWEWLTTHWQWLEENLGSDLSFARLPMYAARCFSDANFLPAYKTFFKPLITPSLERSYQQGLETIEWQSAWKKRDLAQIKEFFK